MLSVGPFLSADSATIILSLTGETPYYISIETSFELITASQVQRVAASHRIVHYPAVRSI